MERLRNNSTSSHCDTKILVASLIIENKKLKVAEYVYIILIEDYRNRERDYCLAKQFASILLQTDAQRYYYIKGVNY